MADTICPNCGGRYHETTDDYVPGAITTGNMLTLKKQYVENGWSSFPEYDSTSFGDMDCPECGGLYSDNGRVTIDEDQYAKEPKPVAIIDATNEMMQRLMSEYEPELLSSAIQGKRKPGRPRR